jgi:uncharacterized protein (DUF2267 family)
MSASGLDVFDKTLQITNTWLSEIMTDIGCDRHVAWHLLGAVLRTVRDRLPAELAAHLGAELPLLVRGTYYDQYRPTEQPDVTRSLDEFLDRVQQGLKSTPIVEVDDAARSVLRVLSRHIDAGQVIKVRDALPKGIRTLWSNTSAAA